MYIKKLTLTILFTICLAPPAIAAERGEELLEAQKERLKQIGIDMNKTGREIYDTFTSEPQKVVESGCLDKIRNVQIDALVIDPMNVLGAVYSALKEEIMNQACSAATVYTNKINDALNQKLELPYGMGSLELGSGGSVTGNDGVFKPNVDIDNEELAEDVTDSVLEDARNSRYDSRSGIQKSITRKFIRSTRANNSSEAEKHINDAIDVDKLWGGDKKEKEETEGGNND